MSEAHTDTKVLYLGDTALSGAASYLAAVLTHRRIDFDYVASDTNFSDHWLDGDFSALIVSDYLASRFSPSQLEAIVARVRDGMGLVMIGGWESFTGLGGDYHTTALADVLPVVMKGEDDRVNSYAPCMILPVADHEITTSLPFATHAVAINGYNQFRAKPDAQTILSLKRYQAAIVNDDVEFTACQVDPLLVVDQVGQGRVACYAGDVAPHWAGGFVDWGEQRHVLQAQGGDEVEIGDWYIQFFGNIVRWVSREI